MCAARFGVRCNTLRCVFSVQLDVPAVLTQEGVRSVFVLLRFFVLTLSFCGACLQLGREKGTAARFALIHGEVEVCLLTSFSDFVSLSRANFLDSFHPAGIEIEA